MGRGGRAGFLNQKPENGAFVEPERSVKKKKKKKKITKLPLETTCVSAFPRLGEMKRFTSR